MFFHYTFYDPPSRTWQTADSGKPTAIAALADLRRYLQRTNNRRRKVHHTLVVRLSAVGRGRRR